MKTKFTPGPWFNYKNTVFAVCHTHKDGQTSRPVVAKCQLSGHHLHKFPKGEAEANARLISLAPDMYELLVKLEAAKTAEDGWRLAGAAKYILMQITGQKIDPPPLRGHYTEQGDVIVDVEDPEQNLIEE